VSPKHPDIRDRVVIDVYKGRDKVDMVAAEDLTVASGQKHNGRIALKSRPIAPGQYRLELTNYRYDETRADDKRIESFDGGRTFWKKLSNRSYTIQVD
jgi:hypothetical protein